MSGSHKGVWSTHLARDARLHHLDHSDYLQRDVPDFLVLAGAASVAIGFAFKDCVGSLVVGVVAIFEKRSWPGDWVEIKNECCEVQSVGLHSLRILTIGDYMITVPHSHIWTESIASAKEGARTLMCVAHLYLAPDHQAGPVRAPPDIFLNALTIPRSMTNGIA